MDTGVLMQRSDSLKLSFYILLLPIKDFRMMVTSAKPLNHNKFSIVEHPKQLIYSFSDGMQQTGSHLDVVDCGWKILHHQWN